MTTFPNHRIFRLVFAVLAALTVGFDAFSQQLPTDVGTTVNGFQDDFDAGTLNTNWIVAGANVFSVSGGLLHVNSATGDPNHLLYELPGYDNSVQEILARVRVLSFGSGDMVRGGLGVAVDPNTTQGINYLFRENTSDTQSALHLAFLDDLIAWGPVESFVWQTNTWYWMRLRQEPNAVSQGGVNDVFGKIWLGDGTQAEPANWQLSWDYTPANGTRTGFAGITASSGAAFQFDVDYILIKATGLPSVLVAPTAFVQIPVAITNQPQSQTVLELSTANFTVGTVGNPDPSYQWFRGANLITAATNATLSLYPVAYSNNGDLFYTVVQNTVSNVNYAVTSSVATLTVIADTNPPVVLGAQSLGLSRVELSFSKPMAAITATNQANYAITGPAGVLSILSAVQDSSQSNVFLFVATMAEQGHYVVTINNLADQTVRGNIIASNSQAGFVASVFQSVGIGNPLVPGAQSVVSNGLTIIGTGTSIAGTSDQFQFSYQLVSGNFDIAARLAGLSLSDTWAKAGLMARETLAPGGRFAASLATPVINGCFFESRDPAGSVVKSSGNFPDNYPNTWLRLNRVGNVLNSFASYDGQTWTLLASQTIALSNQLYLGFAVESDQSNQLATAQFLQITNLPTNAMVGTVPYPYEPLASCSRATPIVFSEIMYKPAPRADTNNTEFLELYNSNPWFHDISGYQITCADMQYTFAAGTIIPGGGFLVVAASPQGIQNVYGITNVMGPYTGSLKKSETLQLIDEHGSILLTVPYSNLNPWPAAADGTGHSMILARPSYGEGDPRAWNISDVTGGSPGMLDAFRPSPLRNVVINELLPHSENAAVPQFVELYNHSSQVCDLSGCILTDDTTTNKFIFPAGTAIGANAFISINQSQLGFTLNGGGGTLFFLKPDHSRVLDAVQFQGQADGTSFGRWPDGANDFYQLATRTPGTNNSQILMGNIVINELMYDPISGNDSDQYIELYNQSTNAVSLANWQFTSGVTFTFPTNAAIGPNGYIVVAKNTSELFSNYANLNPGNTYGNYGGKLSHSGERVALSYPQLLNGSNTIYVVADEVSYGAGGRWGQWSAGGGSSLELIDPHANHRLAANWADSDESQKSSWTTIENTGVLDNGANYESSIAHAQIGMLDVGECLVDNIEADWQGTNYIANPTFESGLANWSLQGSHVRSSLENSGSSSSHSLHLRCSDKFWPAENSCQAVLNSNGMAPGDTVTLRYQARWLHGNQEPDLRLNGNWLEATGILPIPRNLGTPGAPNSAYVTNAGPAVYSVTHNPPVPAANQSVVVTASVHDPDGMQSLILHYRIDPATSYTSVTMKDDGTGGDAFAHDGIYSATIPGKAAQTIVAFYISAADNSGAATRFPALLTDGSPARECVVMFGDGNPGGSFGVYHMWLTQSNITRWANLADLSNEGNDFTFVYDNNRVIYNALGHYSGSPFHQEFDTPVGNLCAYKWVFPKDDMFLGATDFNKLHQPGNSPGDDPSLQREQTTWSFHRALGVPWGYRRFVAVYANGNRRGVLMEDAQVPDSDMVKQYFPNDSGGFLYKMQPWFEFAPFPSGYGIGEAAEAYCFFLPFVTTGGVKKAARYRYNFEIRRTPDSYSDFTNVFSLVDAASSAGSSNYVGNMESVADMEEWMRNFAANHAAGNIDAVGTLISQNMYGYMGVNGTKFTLMPWDLNIDLGWGSSEAWGPGQGLLVSDPSDPNLARIYQTPAFLRMYWRAQEELVNGPLNVSLYTGPLLNAKYSAFVANGLSVEDPRANILPWISQARVSISAQLASVNASAFTVNPAVTVSNDVAYVSGVAPVNVETVWLNGAAWPVTWTSVTNWKAAIPLKAGTNQLNVVGVDIHNQPIAGASNTVTVVYNGAVVPSVGRIVINEIMFDPLIPKAQFVELYNNSTNFTFDLSAWELQGISYVFPSGSLIPPNGFLVLAADRATFAAAYGATNPVFDTFGGSLVPGQTIALVQPGTNAAANLTVTKVRYDELAPWPSGANGFGSSLQLIDPSQDNWRVGNWSATYPPASLSPGAKNTVQTNLPAFPPLWINEIEADNLTGITNSAGQRTPWLEIYNPTANPVSLSGLYLANDFANLTAWQFPAGAVVNPGQFKVVFADGQTGLSTAAEPHSSFTLASNSGSLALSRIYNGQPQVLDYLNYTNLGANDSFGSFPDGQSFERQEFFVTTPGGTNDGSSGAQSSFIAYLNEGEIYTQNFDSLPNPGLTSINTDNPITINSVIYSLANPFDFAGAVSASGGTGGLGLSAMSGWYGIADSGAKVGTRFGATDGDQTTGGDISFGLPDSANRALGLLATSTTGFTGFGARFINGTASTLNHISVTVTAEVWRQSNVPKILNCYYLIDPSASAAFSTNRSASIPALNVSFPTVAADVGGAAVDGTAANNQADLSVFNFAIANWPPGATLWLAWEMPDSTGKAQGLAIDDFSFAASSQPMVVTPPHLNIQVSGDGFVFSSPTLLGPTYQVEYATNLTAPVWTAIGQPITGTGGPINITNVPGASAQGFYRLRILP